MTAEVTDLETSQECYDLNSFAQSHLISHYTPSLLTVQFPHPLNTCLLVSRGRGGGRGGREGGREGGGEGGRGREGIGGERGRGGREGEGGEGGEGGGEGRGGREGEGGGREGGREGEGMEKEGYVRETRVEGGRRDCNGKGRKRLKSKWRIKTYKMPTCIDGAI